MVNFYPYLISSLPMLHFGMKPPFQSERFMEYCARFIAETDLAVLKKAELLAWQDFERQLRNELVKIRAGHLHKDALKYLRQDGYAEPHITHIALNAHRAPSILQGEITLDEERWRFLDGLSIGHYFDLEILLIYYLKLLILEKWDRVAQADKARVLEETLT